MAKSFLNLSNFVAKARSTGFAKQNKFEVEITTPPGLMFNPMTGGAFLSILNCEMTSFPSLNILTRQLRAQGPAYQRPTGIEFSGEGIPLTFIIDQDMQLKAFFDAWLFKIVNPHSAEVSYRDQYITEVKIKQLNELEEVVYEITLYDAFPRSVSLLDLSSSSQNSFHKLTVNFAFRKWISAHEWFQNFDLSPTADVSGYRPIFNDPYKNTLKKQQVSGTTFGKPTEPSYTVTNPIGSTTGEPLTPFNVIVP